MKKQTFKMLLFLVTGIFGIAILTGCPSSKLEGVRVVNLAPWVEWSAIPQDSMQHSANPFLQWFGADRDGQVIDYQYVVLLEEDVDTYGGAAELVSDFPDSIAWISLGNVTETVVPLFASEDTAEYVDQYVFLRCLDDLDAYSDIIYVFLSRNNHPPTCFVTVPEGPRWCLPDTNQFWHGIDVSWEGKDSIDYEGVQPSFIWHVRLYGPFASQPDSTDTLGQYSAFVDPETGIDTLTITSGYIVDLQTGWYILYVRNFDDAHVSSVAALGFFQVFEPRWIRHDDYIDILIVNHNRYWPNERFGELRTIYEDSVNQFYEGIIDSAGFSVDDYDWFDADDENPQIADELALFNYRMVIALDTDLGSQVSTEQQDQYAAYLDVGGMIWVIGRRSFATPSQRGRVDYGPSEGDILPFQYLDMSAAYVSDLSNFEAEFSGANPIVTGFPTLSVDTLRVSYTSWILNHYAEALLGVDFTIRYSSSQTLYVFRSLYPDTSSFHGFPVAVRYDGGVFKSSYFSFPLYFFDDASTAEVSRQMLGWFFEGIQ